jgi:hypothetical protein
MILLKLIYFLLFFYEYQMHFFFHQFLYLIFDFHYLQYFEVFLKFHFISHNFEYFFFQQLSDQIFSFHNLHYFIVFLHLKLFFLMFSGYLQNIMTNFIPYYLWIVLKLNFFKFLKISKVAVEAGSISYSVTRDSWLTNTFRNGLESEGLLYSRRPSFQLKISYWCIIWQIL